MNELLTVMGAVYLTYLVVESHFPPIAWVRGKLLDSADEAMTYLLTCWWCSGFWVSLVLVLVLWAIGVEVHVPGLLVLAGALAAGLIGEIVSVLHMLHANLVKGLNGE